MGYHSHHTQDVFCITLIGMPAVGKTSTSKKLARLLECDFVDNDREMEKKFGATKLSDIEHTLVTEQFISLEGEVAIETVKSRQKSTVFATGGSIIYHEEAMQFLYNHTLVIYLYGSSEFIERRVAMNPDRGIVYTPDCPDLASLYARRTPLYEQWSHHTIESGDDRHIVAARVYDLLDEHGYLTHHKKK